MSGTEKVTFFWGIYKMGVDEEVKKGILVSTKKDFSY